MKETKFKVWYDDTYIDIIETINTILEQFDIEIVDGESGDSWDEFEIRKIK